MERTQYEVKLDNALAKIRAEVLKMKESNPANFDSVINGFSIFAAKTDELWDAVKLTNPNLTSVEEKSIQSGALLCRFIVEQTKNTQGPRIGQSFHEAETAVTYHIESLIKELVIITDSNRLPELSETVRTAVIETLNTATKP